MRLYSLVAMAALLAGPALAASPYMASVSDASCGGKKSCVLTFPQSATMLTIQHVSCGFVTKGETGGGILTVLSTTGAAADAVGDRLPPGAFVVGGNLLSAPVTDTLFFVAAKDQPTVTFTSTSPIEKSTNGGCLISGTSS